MIIGILITILIIVVIVNVSKGNKKKNLEIDKLKKEAQNKKTN